MKTLAEKQYQDDNYKTRAQKAATLIVVPIFLLMLAALTVGAILMK